MNGLSDIQKHRIAVGATILMSVLSLYLVAKLVNEIKAGEYIGAQDQANTIQVTGEGEVFAVPDTATVTFSARGEGSDIKTAQTKEADLINKALAYVKSAGIAEKDIKVTSYSAQPKYQSTIVPLCRAYPCPTPEQKIIGYEVYQSIEVKVRDTNKTSDIIAGLGGVGITDISGPNFSIDDEDTLKADAREKAIADAREKAKVLAKQLGVRVVRITGFQESSGGYPMMYAKADMAVASGAPAPSPEMPKGENKISSTVTITYEIR